MPVAFDIRLLTVALAAALTAYSAQAAVIAYTYVPHATLFESFPSRPIDFNGDSVPELVLTADSTQSGGWAASHVQFQGIASPPPNVGSHATPVPSGALVGDIPFSIGGWISPSSGLFTFRSALAQGTTGFWPTGLIPPPLNPDGTLGLGPLVPESGYLGVRFDLPDGTHYGWVEVGVYPNSSLGYLRSYGWETTPSTPIMAGAPEPGKTTLLILAGLIGTSRRRRALGSG